MADAVTAVAGPTPIAVTPAVLDDVLQTLLVRVRLRAALRAEWLRRVWPDHDGLGAGAIGHLEVDAHLAELDDPLAQQAWTGTDADPQLRAAVAAVERDLDADRTSRLARLQRSLGLAPLERDLVHACLAAVLDPALLRVYAYLADDAAHRYVTDPLVARLFGHRRVRPLDAGSPLLVWRVVDAVPVGVAEPPARVLDPGVRDWLLGNDVPDPELVGVSQVQPVLPPLDGWPVDATARTVARRMAVDPPSSVRVAVRGPAGSGRRSFAAAVADRVGLSLLTVDVTQVPEDRLADVLLVAHRRAFLDGRALAVVGDLPANHERGVPAAFPVQFLVTEAGPTARVPGADLAVDLPVPTLAERRGLWRTHLPWSADWPVDRLDALVRQHRTRPGELAALATRGPGPAEDAVAALRAAGRSAFGDLAERLECPFSRCDLVLPAALDDALGDLVHEARDRGAVWEQPAARRLFPQGRGLIALFAGPPGTGKTMSAQVIAHELGADLVRIDLATVVSKWVGETSRNVDRLLRRAADQDAVLLFDEADALFGRRTEVRQANDRFANTDTGHLLQAIERYDGVALLATNRRGDMDPAFLRRIRYVVDFPVPDVAARARLWRGLVAELGSARPAEAMDDWLGELAIAVDVTGAQIKFAVLAAVFAARRERSSMRPAHLLRGLDRELTKEGRPLTERTRYRLAADED